MKAIVAGFAIASLVAVTGLALDEGEYTLKVTVGGMT